MELFKEDENEKYLVQKAIGNKNKAVSYSKPF